MKELPGKKAAKKVPAKKAAVKKAAKKVPAKKAVKKSPAKKVAKKTSPKKGARNDATASAGRGTSSPRRPALSPPSTDPLLVLGLRPSFTARELQRAWRNHAAKHHPDTGGDAVTFSRGRQAYETLRQGLIDDGRVG